MPSTDWGWGGGKNHQFTFPNCSPDVYPSTPPQNLSLFLGFKFDYRKSPTPSHLNLNFSFSLILRRLRFLSEGYGLVSMLNVLYACIICVFSQILQYFPSAGDFREESLSLAAFNLSTKKLVVTIRIEFSLNRCIVYTLTFSQCFVSFV